MKLKKIGAAFTLIFILNLVSAAYSDESCNMMSGLAGGYGAGVMFFGWITYLLAISLIIAAIYWFIKSAGKNR